jgi:phospholipid transport system substrate-binding protein
MRRGVLLGLLMAGLLCAGNLKAEDATTPMQTARVVVPRPDQLLQAPKASATEVVNGLYGKLLHVMQQGEKLSFQARYDALKNTIVRSFDLPLMTRFAAGTGWLKTDAVQQQKLIDAFSDFSIATYASRFKEFDQEQFLIVGEKPATGGGVIVETRIVPNGDPAVTLNYLLRQDKQGQWRINDVYLDATISEMATRRSEFTAVIRDAGVEALITNINSKAQQMRTL